MEIKLQKLRRFNIIMGALHLIQGIAMLFLATTVIQKIAEFTPVVTQNYLAFNPQTRSLELASKELFKTTFWGVGGYVPDHLSHRPRHYFDPK
jgi:hypothetical protein